MLQLIDSLVEKVQNWSKKQSFNRQKSELNAIDLIYIK